MALMRRNPLSTLPTLQSRLYRVFDDMFPEINETAGMGLMEWRPTLDTYEKDNSVVVKAELPGVKKEDISINVKNNVLSISGERKKEEDIKEENYYRCERFYGKFQRTFPLPENVDAEKVDATYKDGILEITMPKTEENTAKKIEIK